MYTMFLSRQDKKLLQILLFLFRYDSLLLDVDSDKGMDAHVEICNPNDWKACNQITYPVVEQQFVLGDEQNKNSNVMAEAILACKKIKEFSLRDRLTCLRFLHAILPWFAKDLFVSDSPCDTRNRNRQDKEPDYLRC